MCFYNTMENAFNILFYNIVLGLSIDIFFFYHNYLITHFYVLNVPYINTFQFCNTLINMDMDKYGCFMQMGVYYY